MKKFSLVALLFINSITYCQEYTYTHYDITNRLAGSTVYCAEQDKDGFIWFGTETGLSRFDGTNFLNFTIEQGLPDNEVIKIFCDSQNRIWLSLFRSEICFIYNGKVHNQNNDTTLKKIHLQGIAWQVCEDKQGNILIREYKTLHIVSSKGIVSEIKSLKNNIPGFFSAISQSSDGNFLVCDNNSVYELKANGKALFIKQFNIPAAFLQLTHISSNIVFWHSSTVSYTASSLTSDKHKSYNNPSTIINSEILNDSLICINRINGCSIENFYTHEKLNDILPKEPVSSVFIDNENNYWFTTLGHGVFKLNSALIKTIPLVRQNGNPASVFSLLKFKESIVAGTDGCYLFSLHATHPQNYLRYKLNYPTEVKNRIISIQNIQDTLYVGTDDNLLKVVSFKLQRIKRFLSIKHLLLLNKDSLLIGTVGNLLLFDTKKFKVIDTLFNERVTCLKMVGNQIYIGTIKGLVIKNLVTKNQYKTDTSLLNTRITDIEKDENNILWIGTYGAGVVGFKNGKVIITYSEKDGLSSNICRCLFAYENNLWVGTDKGLNKISLDEKLNAIKTYTNTDGLPSNIINTVLQDSQTVFIGTANGITYFNCVNPIAQSKCILHIIAVTSGDDTLTATDILLPPQKNDIRFDYVAISYASSGDIKYYYRINELKNEWMETDNTSIAFPSLNAGNYTFEIKAVNKYGVSSETIKIPFKIEKQLWEKLWIQMLFVIVIGLILWFIITKRIKYIKSKEIEKISTREQIAELKQKALKSQINPHFVFNCLNSIQQYIIDNDVEGSNRFISNFAKIIRKTLDFSERNEITLLEEMNYLDDYLKLERERFENTFTYSIYIDENINAEDYKLPPLILQPLIENAIRHGVRARNDKKGIITINVKLVSYYIVITIEDNGPGIHSKTSKSGKISEHNSMGINLVKERIGVLNDAGNKKILFEIKNLTDTLIFSGTIVKLQFPL